MKQLIEIIKECYACPYHVRSCCEYINRDMDPLEPPTDFPEWCPLEDFIDPADNPEQHPRTAEPIQDEVR